MALLSDLDWDNWLYGAWVAASSGLATAGAASFALYLQDPKDQNPFQPRFWISFATVTFFTAGTNFWAYLKQNPAPKRKETTTTSVVQTPGMTKIEQKVETTEPIPAPKKEEKLP